MAEQYDVAAKRHLDVADLLINQGKLEDAGYHYGVVGENALKHAMRASGLEATWQASGIDPKNTPMRRHYPALGAATASFAASIAAFVHGSGIGRYLYNLTSDPQFEVVPCDRTVC